MVDGMEEEELLAEDLAEEATEDGTEDLDELLDELLAVQSVLPLVANPPQTKPTVE